MDLQKELNSLLKKVEDNFIKEDDVIAWSIKYNVKYEDIKKYLEEHDIEIILDDIDDEDIELLDDYTLSKESKPGSLMEQYFNDIKKVPLLDASEEVELAKKIELGREAKEKLNEPNLTQEEIDEITNQIAEGDKAREKMINANLRLVISMAKKFSYKGILMEDLIQEGNMGLIRAVDKFDYRKGNRFSTYATRWIKQKMSKAFNIKLGPYKIPNYLINEVNKLLKESQKLALILNREPTNEEIAKHLNMDVNKVNDLKRAINGTVYLSTKLSDEDDTELMDYIPNDKELDPYRQALKDKTEEELNKCLDSLSEREARMIRLNFGFIDDREWTYEEIAKEYKLSKERPRQIINKALYKLSKNKDLKDFFNEQKN